MRQCDTCKGSGKVLVSPQEALMELATAATQIIGALQADIGSVHTHRIVSAQQRVWHRHDTLLREVD